MSKKLRVFAFVVALMILMTTVFGCAQQKKPDSSSGNSKTAKVDEKPVDLVYMMPGDAASKPLKDDDRIVSEINKRLGINLKIQIYPQNDNQKVYVSMAAGDVPDILTTEYPSTQLDSWIKDGILVPLNDYLKDTPTMAKKLDERYKWTAVNGKYYGYTFIEEAANQVLYYRADWLEKLGLKPPQNLDDLYTMFKAMTNNDPDGNGKKDTYGATGMKFTANGKPNDGMFPPYFIYIFFAFGVPNTDWSVDDKGNVIPIFETKEYKDAMKFMQKLYSEKLIDPDFIMNDKQAMEQKFFQGKIGFIQSEAFRNWGRIKSTLMGINPSAKLDYLKSYITGPSGKKGSAGYPKNGKITSVTNKAKDPKKAAMFIESLLSPSGRDLLQNGIEGIHYTKQADGKISYNEQERAKDSFAPDGWAHPLAWGHVMWPLTIQYIPDSDPAKPQEVETAQISTKNMVQNLIPYFIDAELKPNQLGVINQEYVVRIITDGLDVDKAIDEWSKKWRSGGGENVLKSLTEEYKKLKK